MQINLSRLIKCNQTVAVALSGGGDSMALLHYMLSCSKKYGFNVIAINIEHGIRGQQSLDDTNFVKDYCKKQNVKLLTYSIDCKAYAEQNKLSLEQAGRVLRYQCFYQAIAEKKCDKIATAHHLKDNFESVLLNLFRGTGLKGMAGIEENFEDKIIRPFLSVSKQEIENYLKENQIPFVTDQTNFSDKYTRNAIRLNILPKIEEIFPEAQNCVYRFSSIAKIEDEYMHSQTLKSMALKDEKVEIFLPLHSALLARATVLALKHLGIEKDWEKSHVDSIIELSKSQNGNKAILINNITAIKEYDRITFYKKLDKCQTVLPFSLGEISFNDETLVIKEVDHCIELKKGFYCDKDKIPAQAVIRTRQDKDKFTKFGGGTKSLNDFFIDKKIPLVKRDCIPILAIKNQVLAIFGIAISDTIKVDEKTKTIIELR